MRKTRLLTLLVLLMAVVTGAWAQQALQVLPITQEIATPWSEDDGSTVLTPDHLPKFYPVTEEAAKGWTDVPQEGTVILIYDIDDPDDPEVDSNVSYVMFNNGQYSGTNIKSETINSIAVLILEQDIKVFYTWANSYTLKMVDGTEDAENWTATVGTKTTAQSLPVKRLIEGTPITLTYNGRLKVKGVKATSDAAAPSAPDGAISGVFSVSSTKQVYFSKGNLRYASGAWSFFDNQYDYYTSYSADAWDMFGWSTSATTYGMDTSISSGDYSGDFVDWGATMGTGWFTLSSAEWTYLFNTRSASTVGGTENGSYAKAKVNDVQGVILFPDTYTHPDGVTAPTGVNATDNTGWNGNSYTVADWTKMESAGCVFLPAAGYRNGSSVDFADGRGYYWSATSNGSSSAYYMFFNPSSLNPASSNGRYNGFSVRLVREVTE